MKKSILLGVTGCIAVYKACEIVSSLKKLGYDVRVVMTDNATEFVSPLTFETLSMNRVVTQTFDNDREFDTEHISLSKLSKACIIAPATANIIGKIANGIADDMLSTTVLALSCPIIICPAMNSKMYENAVVQENLERLKGKGVIIIDPIEGRLACGDVGKGKMAEPQDIVSFVDALLIPRADFRGKTVLVTAGGTEEPIDPVRVITNRSSGKMGIAIANAVLERGGKVILIRGRISIDVPDGVIDIPVKTTGEMFKEVKKHLPKVDIIIKAAAPADYSVLEIPKNKIKDGEYLLKLVKNEDISEYIGKNKQGKILVVFAAETSDLIKNAYIKLSKKNADMIVANDITQDGAGFDKDTNIATIIRKDGPIIAYEKMQKIELAHEILNNILEII